MIVQFNLLPDVKIEYLKAKRQQHLVTVVSTIGMIASVVVFVFLLMVVFGVQRQSIKNLNSDIDLYGKQLRDTPDLDKILTVQNQLKILPKLHDDKVISSRLYSYLSQVTPVQATISQLSVDYELNVMIITGNATDLAMVNTYVDTLKFTKFSIKGAEEQKLAFSDVVLINFGRNEEKANYEVSLKFDPQIFVGTEEVTLSVPQIISTRSELAKPNALFQANSGGQ